MLVNNTHRFAFVGCCSLLALQQLLLHGGAVDDGDANVGLRQRANVVRAITAHQSRVAQRIEASDEKFLVMR